MLQKCFFILFIGLATSYGFASEENSFFLEGLDSDCQISQEWQPKVEAKIGYFFFSNSKMRKVFNRGGIDLQFNSTYPACKNFQIYGSVEYLEKHGKSLGGHQSTEIWAVPFSLGLKYQTSLCHNVSGYFTLGPRYFYIHVHNLSSYVDRNMQKTGLGFFANAGVNYFICNNLLIDLFGEYSYGRFHFHSSKKNTYEQTTQIGGFVIGGGLEYFF